MEAFESCKPITLDDFEHAWVTLEADLEMLGLTDIELIGSTGKNPVMGDVDVAARHPAGRDGLYEAAVKVFGQDRVRKVGGNIVSFCYQMDVPMFQVDVMVGDPKYLRWARAGTSNDPSHPDFSHVKNVARNVLLNVITRFVSEQRWPMPCELTRARMIVDFDKGLYEVNQTKQGKNGKALKDWKTTVRFCVTQDPDETVRRIFGRFASAQDTRTFEGVVATLRASKWKKLAPQILQTFATEMRELGNLLGEGREKALEYIDATARG